MLCDDVLADGASVTGCDIAPLVARIRRAQRFVLEPGFAATAEALAEDFGGLVRVFDHCRLPFADTWIEVAQADRPHFMAAGVQLPGIQKRPRRVGFLLTATRPDLSAWKTHLFWSFDTGKCGVAMLAAQIDMTHPVSAITELDEHGPPTISGREVQTHPGWAHANDSVRLMMVNHTCMVGADFALDDVLRGVPLKAIPDVMDALCDAARSDWAGESAYLLAVIGLLNTRNVVEIEKVDQAGLNKARVKRGKPPLLEHKTLKIAWRQTRHVTGRHNGDHAPMRAHMCRGHWKVRKSGIFFWSPHMRGDIRRGHIEKDYKVG